MVSGLCASLEAATIYVDNTLSASCSAGRYSVASRSCTGTDGAGYSTFSAGIAAMQPGDTLAIRGGTYRTGLVINKSGTATAHLKIGAHNNENVLIDLNGVSANGIAIGSQKFLDIYGIKVSYSSGYGFQGTNATDITVSDCEFGYSYHAGMVFEGGARISVTRVSVHHSHRGGNWHEAITFQDVDVFSITDSDVYENNKEGIDAKYNARRGVIARNHTWRNNGPNIYIDAASDIDVYGNLCHDTRSAQKACIGLSIESAFNPQHYPTKDVAIFNNVVYGSGAGIWLWVETVESWAKFENIRIEYNTIVDNTQSNWGGIFFFSAPASQFGAGNTIRNNIFMGNNGGAIKDQYGSAQLFRIDRNLFGAGEATFGTNATTTATSPFVNRAGKDFHLTATAAARGIGAPIADITTDLEGVIRPLTATDVGAYQQGGERAVTPPPTAPVMAGPPSNVRVTFD